MYGLIPKRYILTFVAFTATTLSVALQTNLSLTIVYMVQSTHDKNHISTPNECSAIRNISYNSSEHSEPISGKLDWSTEIQGYAIGFQYVGMILGYVPGGRLGELYGAKNTMMCSMLLASVFTVLSSTAAKISAYVFIICRALVGLGTAPVFPVIVIMISKWIPESERSLISSIMLAGYGTGASVSYLTAGALCSSDFLGGWPSVFYLSGIFGIIWCVWCYFIVNESPDVHPTISLKELEYLQKSIGPPPKEMKTVPWKSMVTSIPVWSLAIGTFGQFWLLAFFVTSHAIYMGTVLNLESTQNGVLSCVPNFLRALFACIVGGIIDWVRERRNFPIVYVRKGVTLCNAVTACLGFIGVIYAGCDPNLVTVAFILSGLCGDFCIFGVSLVPTDIAPSLRGTLAGILCSIGSIPYFLLPSMIGIFTKHEQSIRQWKYIYYCTIGVTIVTTLVYIVFGTSDPQPWALENNNSIKDAKDKEDEKKNEKTDSHTNGVPYITYL
ncbi:uncharacterized transporter slc-17.2 [Nephila pilipes]|uniref:Uncharacterized transporter slc-17.2 n=1 Tax=Nephila pilipes TaxID=299642 RepID=A0A8X6PIT8_NEPPI|nr:uncharacterized transporter slc-17.2 [Nephila pilipes]